MEIIQTIAQHFPIGAVTAVEPLASGIVHKTYRITSEQGIYILQCMNSAFAHSVLEDMRAVTEHLAQKNFPSFSIVAGGNGELAYHDGTCHWRMLTYLPGHTLIKPSHDSIVSAGELVGRFHNALADYSKTFTYTLSGFHDTHAYMQQLVHYDSAQQHSPKHKTLSPLSKEILEKYHALPRFERLLRRVGHGDLKLANILFDEYEKAFTIIDLDTVGYYPLSVELGDMLRSWTKKVDASGTVSFDLDVYRAALTGYRRTVSPLKPEEWRTVPIGVMQTALELSARCVIDAYEEKYFVHDTVRFSSLYEQNVSKAQENLAFCTEVQKQYATLESM